MADLKFTKCPQHPISLRLSPEELKMIVEVAGGSYQTGEVGYVLGRIWDAVMPGSGVHSAAKFKHGSGWATQDMYSAFNHWCSSPNDASFNYEAWKEAYLKHNENS